MVACGPPKDPRHSISLLTVGERPIGQPSIYVGLLLHLLKHDQECRPVTFRQHNSNARLHTIQTFGRGVLLLLTF